MRFYHIPPQTDTNQTIATFDPNSSSGRHPRAVHADARATASASRWIRAPASSYPNPYIGLFVPDTGEPANGAAVGGVNGYPAGLYTVKSMYLGPAPRLRLGRLRHRQDRHSRRLRHVPGPHAGQPDDGHQRQPAGILRSDLVLRHARHLCQQRRHDRPVQHQRAARRSRIPRPP